MAGNSKAIVKDLDNKPAPQYYNPLTDSYEYLQGRNGATKTELYGPDGNPLSATDGKLNVRAAELESVLSTIQGIVDSLNTAIGQAQASPTANTVLARLKDLADRLGEVSANPSANTLLARLKTLEGYLDGVEIALNTHTTALGAPADAEAEGNGSLIAIVKRVRTLVGQGIVTLGSAVGSTGLLVAGSDGTNARAIKTADDGTVLTQLTGSTIQDSQAIPMTQAHKDIVARATDRIIDTIGAENIKLFLPMNETSGNTAYDLLRRDLTFSINGATLGVQGTFGPCMSFDGTNDRLVQNPETENNAGDSFLDLNSGTMKAATKMNAISCNPGFVRLNIKKTGTLDTATIRVAIHEDNSGVPSDNPITDGVSTALACSIIDTTARDRGFAFPLPCLLYKNKQYWLVLSYVDSTGVDTENYISWAYESGSNTYGQRRSVHDGESWVATDGENHIFGLWNNALSLTGDFSIVSLADNNDISSIINNSRTIICTSSMDKDCMDIRQSSGGYFSYRINDGSTTRSVGHTISLTPSVYVFTCNYLQSTSGKFKGYFNGLFAGQTIGGASASILPQAQPFTIGSYISNQGILGSYWKGNIGPVIITSSELSSVQIGKISHELLVLRKYGVEV